MRRALRSSVTFALAAALQLLAACSTDAPTSPARGGVDGPAVASRHAPGGGAPSDPTGIPEPPLPPLPEWLVLFEVGADPLQLATDYGLSPLRLDSAARLGVLLGTVDPVLLLADVRVRALQSNSVTAYDEPVDLTQGFHQGGWEEGVLADQQALGRLHLPQVHRLARGDSVLIAVLDTGVDPTHPYLEARTWLTPLVPPDLGQVETRNNLDDDVDGATDEAYGHGTHVAGIALTVAPSARLLPIRVLNDDGFGTAYDLCRGIFHATQLGARIVNLSLVLSADSPVVHETLVAATDQGVIVVAAAGNQPDRVGYPASDPAVLGIAAVDGVDVVAAFSGRGAIGLAAPGVAVESCFPGDLSAVGTGTSMASPAACGSLALLLAPPLQLSPAQAVELAGLTAGPLVPQSAVLQGRVAPLSAVKQWMRSVGARRLHSWPTR